MPPDLLLTKLTQPGPHRRFIARPRLHVLLSEGMARRLTLIAAPAGSGKTTLLGEWLRAHAGPAAWVSLDAADNDPARFWAYLLAALEAAYPGVAATELTRLQHAAAPAIESLLVAVLNRIARSATPVMLVLDDYHAITAIPIREGMTFLLDHLPTNMHLVIATRADPALPLARWRVRDEVVEVRTSDLRFTPDEAAAFLTGVMGVPLTEADIAALAARTEGWVAGLQLAALSLRGRSDPHAFIAAFGGSQRFVTDYLVEEVLDRQPEHVRRFLLETSVLDRLCGPLCDAVCDSRSSQALLEHLEAENLFVVPLDEERRWYRYHHLFAAVLRSHLAHVAPDRVQELYWRASDWCGAHGLIDEALEYALGGRDWERAATLLEAAYRPLINRGQQATLRRWFEALPEEVRAAHPWIAVNYAWILLFLGEIAAFEGPLALAEQTWRSRGDRAGLGEVYRVHAMMARLREDAAGAIRFGRESLADLSDDAPLRSSAMAAVGAGLALTGDLAAAEAVLADAHQRTDAIAIITRLLIENLRGAIAALRGDLHGAAAIYQRVLAQAGERPFWQVVDARIALGDLAREWDNLAQAERWVHEGIDLARQTQRTIFAVRGYLVLAQIQRAQGHTDEASATLAQAREIARSVGNARAGADVAAQEAEIALARGDGAAVARWQATVEAQITDAHDEQRTAPDDATLFAGEQVLLTLARVFLARRDPERAVILLRRLLDAAERQGRTSSVIAILTLLARSFAVTGEHPQATQALTRALRLAEPGGYRRLFLDAGRETAAILSRVLAALRETQAAEDGPSPAYVRALLHAYTDGQPADDRAAAPLAGATTIALDEPLTGREREVLQLLADGLSNNAIADRLFVGVGTVRTHIKSLYGKLDVHSRTQAVARARALGLL